MRRSYPKLSQKVSFLICLFVFTGVISGCAYRLGSPDRSLPGGYRQVFIPIFKNRSMEPGIEVAFTNSLIQEYERAKIARVTDASQAEVVAEGVIESVTYSNTGNFLTNQDEKDFTLPLETSLASQYQINIKTQVILRRNSDKSILWTGTFQGTKTYNAPQVTASGINTVNPLYNLSARRQNIELLAAEMMSEAHDRTTENF